MPRSDADEGSNPYKLGDGKITRETEKAVLFVTKTGDQLWVPKSVVHDDSDVFKNGDEGEFKVKHWWAAKNDHVR